MQWIATQRHGLTQPTVLIPIRSSICAVALGRLATMSACRNYSLRADHASAVLGFELANRSFFGMSISDRGDDYFHNFSRQHNVQAAEQETGTCIYHVLADDDDTIFGRFNPYEIHDGSANVGYRIAHKVAGRGIATASPYS